MPEREHVPVREPEISELRAFCAAASLGSIAEAARAMNVSQPAMSKRLRTLETVVGAELLVRSTRGVTLTPAGEQLYTVAQRLLASADAVTAVIGSPIAAEAARLACSPTAAEQRLSVVLARMGSAGTAFSAELTTANSWVVRELVAEGPYELGVVAVDRFLPRADDLQERVLWRDEVGVGVPTGHPWEQLEEIPLEEFISQPLVERDPWAHSSRLVTVVLEAAGVQRTIPAVQIGSTLAVVTAALELGIPAVLSGESIKGYGIHGLHVRRVAGISFDREFALVWNGAMAGLTPAAQAVAQRLISDI